MNYYKSEFHEKLVRIDPETGDAFAKPIGGGDEYPIDRKSNLAVDAHSTPIDESEY